MHLQGSLLTAARNMWLRPCSERRGGNGQQLCQPEPARVLLIKHNEAWDPRTFLLIQGSHEVRRSCWLAVEKAGHRGVCLREGCGDGVGRLHSNSHDTVWEVGRI